MLFSEAIRLGSMFGPKCKNKLTKDGGFCAMGAAYLALGSTPVDLAVSPDKLRKELKKSDYYKTLLGKEPKNKVMCNECVELRIEQKCLAPTGIWNSIVCLNNHTDLTREQIADWVQEEEKLLGLWKDRDEVIEDNLVEEKELVYQ